MPSSHLLSNARAYFEHIRSQSDPFFYLSNIPSSLRPTPFFEEEWLDFKGSPMDDKDAKKIWSKALSGYANITDGLVIWGIDARPTPPRNIDAACGLRLIPDPHAFESKLRDWIRDATNPPVTGVEYQSYTGPIGEGFVVNLIPQSEHKPHRAEFADKHYYYRAGDDFLIAEPGLLRTLFYPHIRPYMVVEATLRFQFDSPFHEQQYRKDYSVELFNKLVNSKSSLSYDVKLHNSGAATAKNAYVVVQTQDDLSFDSGADWSRGNNPQGRIAFQAKRPFHPGEATELFKASILRNFYNRPLLPSGGREIIPHFDKVSLGFLIYTENSERQELVVEFIPEDFNFQIGSATKKALQRL
jgi:hypothetical protein